MNLHQELEIAEDLLEDLGHENILGSALLSITTRHMLADLLERISPDDFANPHLETIWRAAKAITVNGGSVSKRTILADPDVSQSDAAKRLVGTLAGEPVTAAKITTATSSVLEMSKSRRLIQALKRIGQFAQQSASYSESLQFASQQLATLSEAQPSKESRSFADALTRWQEWLAEPSDRIATVETPWPELDDLLAGGLHPGRSYVIGGRPGAGKSLALLNFASHAAEHAHPGVVFSVEMGEIEVVSRIMASGAHAEYRQITRRDIDDRNHAKIAEYVATYRDMPLTLVDKSDVTVDYIAATCRTLKRTRGLEVIAVDYLQLLRETDSKQSRERQVAHISRSMKVLARELDCVVIIACQLNRNAASDNRRPTLADLRESGAIEQDADVVILLHHELLNNQPTGEVDLMIAKNRTGRMGTVSLPFRGYQARIG